MPGGCFEVTRRLRTDARMIIIEDKHLPIMFISAAADSLVTGTQIATLEVFRRGTFAEGCTAGDFAMPRAILTMGGNDHPFLAKRMPSLFPSGHAFCAFCCLCGFFP